ncbi:hypothetical protein DVA67_014670 [Solirubrobacter sp. CPCC 204708]|uniref:Htaa domain-containing protein n=1 Tax=Solirubrobacter deserti TaxID=2282478 RepID=A0ABT4RBH0_9ACTN|nr:hypothetical protein [Solirubrobacter deserti]MBE2317222.1 hypothetical protein [Solirubrobacter deserti]MDA0135885.1 hypothetical protein [Solirubrobacter deserti]
MITINRRLAGPALAGALLTAAAPASAADFTVTGGRLDWTMANQFDSTTDNTRTWLGYATQTTGGFPPNGRIEATAPATLTNPVGASIPGLNGTATPTPARGVNERYKLTYPASATGSTFSTTSGGKLSATVELTGKFTFIIHEGRNFKPGTIVDPVITIDGATGTLRSSGTKIAPAVTSYDRNDVQFNLDLSDATVSKRPDGSHAITNIVPVSTAQSILSGFGANSRLYGTMALTVAADEILTAAAPAKDGATGPAGPAGPAGKDGRDAELRVIRLSRAAFATKAEVHVRLIDPATKKTVARGTVERRTLRLSVLQGTTLKGGTYTLQRTAKKATGKRTATISFK